MSLSESPSAMQSPRKAFFASHGLKFLISRLQINPTRPKYSLPRWTKGLPLHTLSPPVPSLTLPSRAVLLQIFRYLLCGGTAFVVHQLVVYGLGYSINPAFGDALSDEIRFTNSAINHSIAFLISNTVAYLLNVRFVFTPGRFKRRTEVSLFFLASAISFFPALYSLDVIIRTLSLNSHVANIVFAGVAASANFVVRKFLIFNR